MESWGKISLYSLFKMKDLSNIASVYKQDKKMPNTPLHLLAFLSFTTHWIVKYTRLLVDL